MYHVEGQKAPLILNMYENDYMWAKNKFGYNIKFCTDCFNEIIFLDKWACTKKLAQPKTFFSSKSWRSFSKKRLHTTDTCHCSILSIIEKNSIKRWGPLWSIRLYFRIQKPNVPGSRYHINPIKPLHFRNSLTSEKQNIKPSLKSDLL